MDLAEQDFDIVSKKFMTVCSTQCPVPEVIYLLQTFTVSWPCLKFHRVTSAVVWLKENVPAAFDGKINFEEPPLQQFSACILKGLNMESVCTIRAFHKVL